MLLRRLNSRVVCAVIMLMVVVGEVAPRAEAGVANTCRQLISFLTPCVGYLQNGGFVPPRCCINVRNLAMVTRTRADRRLACFCFKAAISRSRSIKSPNAQSLPAKCGAKIPYPISSTANCNSVG